jgi:hypothetical protein
MLAAPTKDYDVLVGVIRDRREVIPLGCHGVLGASRAKTEVVVAVISIWRGMLHCCLS